MLVEQGRVVDIESDGLWVETLKKSACDSCAARSGCGQRLLADTVTKNMSRIKAFFPENHIDDWQLGDHVEIGISENALVVATLMAYLIPLSLMVTLAFVGSHLGDGDLASAAGALFGLGIGAMIVRWHSFKQRANARYHAIVIGQTQPLPSLHCTE